MELKPAALLQLLDKDLNGFIPSNSQEAVAVSSLRSSLVKKFLASRSPTAGSLAIDGFRDRAKSSLAGLPDLSIARAYCHRVLGPLMGSDEMVDGMRFGPGSALTMTHESTSGYVKACFGESSVSTEDAYKEYLGLLMEHDPRWYAAEILRRYNWGPPSVTASNKIITVPKTDQIDRVIAVEPTINTALQQGVRCAIEARLLRSGVDLRRQSDLNRAYARKGSLDRTLATVDFSAASDSISVDLLRELLPEAWFEYVMLVSSPNFSIKGELIRRGRIALTMGNAITFPLMTLIFRALVVQTYRLHPHQSGIIAVFGDDVILSDDVAGPFLELATGCGFSPNIEKSFSGADQEFRESCGADWHLGVNVRGVYLRRLTEPGDFFVAFNLLAAWSYRWSIPLANTLKGLLKEVESRKWLNFVPLESPIDSGIRLLEAPAYDRWEGGPVWNFKTYRKKFKKRDLCIYDRVHEFYKVQGHLQGWLSSGFVQERPTSGGRWTLVKCITREWMRLAEADAWMYDVSRTTSGFSREVRVD